MGQQRWKYVDVFGKIFYIGLFHGDESGHLMIYINNRISVIDFHILEEKSYSFVMGPEIVKVKIEKDKTKNPPFSYSISHSEVPRKTPAWEKFRDKMIIWLLVFAGFTVLFVLLRFLLD